MRKPSQSGFTLIELAIVCVMIVILADLAIPQIQGSLSLYRLSSSANLVASELNAARALAVSRNWNYEISTTDNTIQVVDPRYSNNNPRVAYSLEADISFFSADSIQFYSRGYADGGDIVVQNGTQKITVTVLASGKVKIGDMWE